MTTSSSTSFTSPTTGLTIARAANGEELLARFLTHELPLATAVCPPDHDVPYQRYDQMDMSFQIQMGAGDLGEVLEQLFGPPDGDAPGKYQDEQVFFFDFQGHMVVARCEKGDRGSAWMLGLDPASPLNQVNGSCLVRVMAPESAPFWPDFVVTLAEAMGHTIDQGFLQRHFPPGAMPVLRHERWLLEEGLNDAIPTLSRLGPRL